MNIHEKKAYAQYLKQTFAPVSLKNTKSSGYEVLATNFIKLRTIVFAYVGDICSLRQIIEKNI